MASRNIPDSNKKNSQVLLGGFEKLEEILLSLQESINTQINTVIDKINVEELNDSLGELIENNIFDNSISSSSISSDTVSKTLTYGLISNQNKPYLWMISNQLAVIGAMLMKDKTIKDYTTMINYLTKIKSDKEKQNTSSNVFYNEKEDGLKISPIPTISEIIKFLEYFKDKDISIINQIVGDLKITFEKLLDIANILDENQKSFYNSMKVCMYLNLSFEYITKSLKNISSSFIYVVFSIPLLGILEKIIVPSMYRIINNINIISTKDAKNAQNVASSFNIIINKLVDTQKYLISLSSLVKEKINYDGILNNIKNITSLLKESKDNLPNIKLLNTITNRLTIVKDILKQIKSISSQIILIGLISIPMTIMIPLAMLGMITFMGYIKLLNIVVNNISKNFNDKDFQQKLNNIKNVNKLILLCSFIVIVGAMSGKLVSQNFVGIIFFGVALFTMVMMLGGLCLLINKLGLSSNNSQKGSGFASIKGLVKLIAISTLVLLIGGMFVKNFGEYITGAFVFGLLLSAFVLLISFSIKLMGNINKGILTGFTFMLITCTTILMLGGMFVMNYPQYVIGALVFGVILGAFVLLISYSISLMSKVNPMVMVGFLSSILLISVIFMIAGYIFTDNNKKWAIVTFALVTGLYTFGMVKCLNMLSKNIVNISIGTLALLGIAGATLIFAGSFWIISQASKNITLGDVVLFCSIITLMGAAAFGLGALLDTGIGAALFMSGITGMILLGTGIISLGMGILSVGVALKKIKEIGNPEQISTSVTKIISSLVGGVLEVYNNHPEMFEIKFDGLFSTTNPFYIVVEGCKRMGKMISEISDGVQDFANLSIPIYDKNGKYIGRRNMNDNDFKLAEEHIGQIISTIGAGMMTAFDNHKDWFIGQPSFKSLLFGTSYSDTPISKICITCESMGLIISKIGKSIQEISSLRLQAYDNNGNIIPNKFIELQNGDFQKVGENINTIITSIGGSFISVGEKNPEMFGFVSTTSISSFFSSLFSSNFNSESPIVKITKGTMCMVEIVGKISNIIKELSTMNFVTKYDSNGNPIETKHITSTDIEEAIKNISGDPNDTSRVGILTTIPQAFKLLSQDPNFKNTDNVNGYPVPSNVSQVVKSLQGMGEIVNNITQGVIKIATGQVPKGFNDDGSAQGYTSFNSTHSKRVMDVLVGEVNSISFDGNGKPIIPTDKAIGIIPLLAITLGSLYDYEIGGEKIFQSDIFRSDTRFQKVVKSVSSIGELIKNITDSVISLSQGNLPTGFDVNGKPTGYQSILDIDTQKVTNIISNVITAIPNAIMKVFSETKESTTTSGQKIKQTVLNDTTKIFKELSSNGIFETLTGVIDNISKISNLLNTLEQNKIDQSNFNTLSTMIGQFNGATLTWADTKKSLFAHSNANVILDNVDKTITTLSSLQTLYSNSTNNDQFPKVTKQISNFIDVVGKVDIRRADQLTQLFNAMNQFAQSVGSMDKLSESISNKLSVVLQQLVRQMSLAMTSINNADRLNENRNTAMKNIIDNIKQIMEHPILITYPDQDNLFDFGDSEGGIQFSGSATSDTVNTSNMAQQGRWAGLANVIRDGVTRAGKL